MIRELFAKLFHRQAPWFERYFIWILLGGVVLAVAACLAIGMQQSVWFDDAYSIQLAKRPLGELLALTSVDTHPPLYYLLLKLWAGLFGWSEFALRSLSVLAMGGAVFVAGLFTRRFFGVRAALWTLPFLVLAPFLLRYGFEIRMYSLASLIGIAATYVLALALTTKNSRRQWQLYAAYAVLVAVGVFTLYYTAILWITHLVWLIWMARRNKQPVMKQRWWLAYAGSVVLFLPWLPTFIKQVSNGALAPISQQMTADNMVGVLSFAFLYRPAWQLDGILSLLIAVIFGLLIYVVIQAAKIVKSTQKTIYILLGLYAFLPIILVALISLIKPMYVERYLAHTLIGFSLFVGVSLWLLMQKQPRYGRMVAGVFIASMLLGIGYLAQVGNYNFQRLQKPEIKQVASQIKCDQNMYVLAADPYVATELDYYMPHCDVHFYSETADLKGGYAPFAYTQKMVSDPEQELMGQSEITYVYYDEPKLQLPENLRETTVQSYGPLHIAWYRAE